MLEGWLRCSLFELYQRIIININIYINADTHPQKRNVEDTYVGYSRPVEAQWREASQCLSYSGREATNLQQYSEGSGSHEW